MVINDLEPTFLAIVKRPVFVCLFPVGRFAKTAAAKKENVNWAGTCVRAKRSREGSRSPGGNAESSLGPGPGVRKKRSAWKDLSCGLCNGSGVNLSITC